MEDGLKIIKLTFVVISWYRNMNLELYLSAVLPLTNEFLVRAVCMRQWSKLSLTAINRMFLV